MNSSAVFGTVPELIEARPGAILAARDQILKSMSPTCIGPCDLVVVEKEQRTSVSRSPSITKESLLMRSSSATSVESSNSNLMVNLSPGTVLPNNARSVSSSYHYVIGGDVSSAGAMAAYIQDLVASPLEQPSQLKNSWFSKQPWKVCRVVYCSYDALTRTEVRVQAQLPGSVTVSAMKVYDVESISDEYLSWTTLWITSVLRSVLFKDDGSEAMQAVRLIDPFASATAIGGEQEAYKEVEFVNAVENLIRTELKSHRDSESGFHKHFVVNGMLRFFASRQRPMDAVAFFRPLCAQSEERLNQKQLELGVILARALCLADAEPEAVRVLCQLLSKDARLAPALIEQSRILQIHASTSEAVFLAKQAIVADPIDCDAWIRLAEAHVAAKEYALALTVLNSCPVSAAMHGSDFFIPASVQDQIHIPLRDSQCLQYLSIADAVDEWTVSLVPAAAVIEEAYDVVISVMHAVGWDGLLSIRESVFWMHEEDQDAKKTSKHLVDGSKEIIEPRLCERWLDQIFCKLYVHMQLATAIKSEFAHQGVCTDRSIQEWHTIGVVLRRLQYLEDAGLAFSKCVEPEGSCLLLDDSDDEWQAKLEGLFCIRDAWMSLLSIYAAQGRTAHAISAAHKALSMMYNEHHRQIMSMRVMEELARLVRMQGLIAVRSSISSLDIQGPPRTVLERFLDDQREIKSIGYDF